MSVRITTYDNPYSPFTEQMAAQEAAIDEIIAMHPDGFYKKVKSK